LPPSVVPASVRKRSALAASWMTGCDNPAPRGSGSGQGAQLAVLRPHLQHGPPQRRQRPRSSA
jgi:hypothetical protein